MAKAAFIFVAIASAVATAGVALLITNIAQRKQEARETVFRISDITE